MYNAIVRPYFDYSCEVWDVFSETQSKRLQKLPNRAAGIILNMSNGKMAQLLKWVLSHSLIYFHIKVRKQGNQLRDISSSSCLPKRRTNNMKNSFMFDGAKLWNSISKDIRQKTQIYRICI